MDTTLLQMWLLITLPIVLGGERLLKVPRIYNALITSDEDLLPSQAYPAVAPVLRPSAGPLLLPAAVPAPATASDSEERELPEPSPARLPSMLNQESPSLEAIKNNKPNNPEIPDVVPPPLPVSATFKKQ